MDQEKKNLIFIIVKVRKIFDNIEFNCNIHRKFNIKNEGLKNNVKNSIDWFFLKLRKV